MNFSLPFFGISVIVIVVVLWIWAIVDLLKKELSGPELTKWLVIILVFPIGGFFLYSWLGGKKYKVK